jgi:hypothetical protein
MLRKICLFCVYFCFYVSTSTAQQLGGYGTFNFLRLPQGTRAAALGGINISADPKDATLFVQNPALMHQDNHRQLALNYTAYYAGISYLTSMFALNHPKTGDWAAAIQYLNYGSMDSYDAAGNSLGTFSAQDYALTIGYSRQIRVFRLGMNLKYIGSAVGSYQNNALLFDVGGVFIHPKHDWRIGLVIKNTGFALGSYTPSSQFTMPFDVQLGSTFKPKKMPFRFSVTMHHLFPTSITYNDPSQKSNQVDEFGNPVAAEVSFIDSFSRRFVLGAEVIVHKNFQLRAGYNFMTRRELGIANQSKGLTGLSLGFMLQIKGFEFAYTYSAWHLAGGLSTLGLTVDTKKIFAKK